MDKTQNEQSVDRLVKLLLRADEPFDADSVSMDCREGCEDVASLAERVAKGESLKDIFPAFADHMEQIGCCKEEFDALVSVIRAERDIEAELDGIDFDALDRNSNSENE